MNHQVRVLLAAIGSMWLAFAVPAQAASNLSLSLTGFSGDTTLSSTRVALGSAGLNVFSTGRGRAVIFDASGSRFGLSPGDNGRNYLRTNASDYATTSFVAEITFEVSSDDQAVLFGIGAGELGVFGIPDMGTQFSSASFWPVTAQDKFIRFRTANDLNVGAETIVPAFDVGTHRFRMTYDALARSLFGQLDMNYAGGPFVADHVVEDLPIAVAALFAADGWPTEPSRIFFGGDDGTIFRDLAIRVLLPGDTNSDSRVDLDDLNNVRNNFGANGPDDGSLAGDAFPFDGIVDLDDLNGVRNNFGTSTESPGDVPEPSTSALAVLTICIAGFHRCRRGYLRKSQSPYLPQDATEPPGTGFDT